MTKIIEKVKTVLSQENTLVAEAAKQLDLECNYENNYYGDQYCQSRADKK